MNQVSHISGVGRLRKANKAEVAEFFDVSVKSVDGWVRRGCPVVTRGDKLVSWVFDLLEVATWRINGSRPGDDIDPETLPPGERKSWYDSETKRRDLQVRDRELIKSDEVERSVATAFAAVAQSIRSLPDRLERTLGLAPETVEAIGNAIDDNLDDLADRLSVLGPVGDADE